MFHLCRFALLLLHLPPDESVQHRLEQVDHELDFSFLPVAREEDHFVLVARHQTFVADGGFLVKFMGQEIKWGRGETIDEECGSVCVMCVLCACRQTYCEGIHGFDVLSELHGGCYKDGLRGRQRLPTGAEIIDLKRNTNKTFICGKIS